MSSNGCTTSWHPTYRLSYSVKVFIKINRLCTILCIFNHILIFTQMCFGIHIFHLQGVQSYCSLFSTHPNGKFILAKPEWVNYLFTYLLTPCSRVLLAKITSSKLVNKLSAFYGTRRFITTFTSARQLSVSWASLIQSILLHTTSRRSVLIFSSHVSLGLPRGLFPSGFPTKNLYEPLLLPNVLHAPPISFFSIWLPK